jgi:hypothetical protein
MTFQRNFLPSFDSFGNTVSEKIFLEINQSETRMACGAMIINGSELNEQSL